MNKYRIEFGFGENIFSITEWSTSDDLMVVEAESRAKAALDVLQSDGMEGAFIKVLDLVDDGNGGLDIDHSCYHVFSIEDFNESSYKKYYVGQGDMPLTADNALRKFDTAAEAEEWVQDYRKEILDGVYDEEHGWKPKEREEMAEQVFAYAIESTPSGAIRHKYKI